MKNIDEILEYLESEIELCNVTLSTHNGMISDKSVMLLEHELNVLVRVLMVIKNDL